MTTILGCHGINKFSQSFLKDHLKTFDISDGPLGASVSAQCIAGPSEGLKIRGCQYHLVGKNCPPLVEIGLTDLPKSEGIPWHPRHPQGRQA